VAVKGDVSAPEDCEALFDAMDEHFGGVDILAANAGIQADAMIADMTLEQWQTVIGVNLTGQFLCAQAAVRRFRAQGLDASRSPALGKIIFTSSVHEEIPWAGHVNYAASKGGLKLLMESLAQELAPEKIRVNSIAPGAIKTAINEEAWERRRPRPSSSSSSPMAASASLRTWPRRRCGWRRRVRLRHRHDAVRRRRHDALSRLSAKAAEETGNRTS
jgi:glucose 1-dehydrogenase